VSIFGPILTPNGDSKGRLQKTYDWILEVAKKRMTALNDFTPEPEITMGGNWRTALVFGSPACQTPEIWSNFGLSPASTCGLVDPPVKMDLTKGQNVNR